MSTFPLSYCPHGNEATSRLSELFVDRVGDRICAAMEVPSPAMDKFKRTHVDGYCEFPDLVIGSYHMERWPIFNVADMAVSCGIIVTILLIFFHTRTIAPSSPDPERPAD